MCSSGAWNSLLSCLGRVLSFLLGLGFNPVIQVLGSPSHAICGCIVTGVCKILVYSLNMLGPKDPAKKEVGFEKSPFLCIVDLTWVQSTSRLKLILGR